MIPSPHSAPLAALLQRVREEYREMPGLALTKPQATRLFGVAPSVCAAVLKALVMENFLSRTREGVFIRVVASIGLVAGLAAVLSAQAPLSNGKVDQNGVHSIRVQVIGCVTGDADAGRYILTGAFLRGDADKRGGGAVRVTFDEAAIGGVAPDADVIRLDDALKALAALDDRKGRVVELRFFGGLTVDETAVALKVSSKTVLRDWEFARAWLQQELTREAGRDA